MPLEMSLLAADVVHNTRVALDRVLARLKDHFGGDVGKGSFPSWQSEDEWQRHVVNNGKRSPLYGLDEKAVDSSTPSSRYTRRRPPRTRS
jgi:hypothetical protein